MRARSAAAVFSCLAVAGCGGGGGGESASGPDGTQLWFTSGEQFRTVERELPASADAGLRPAVKELVEGPTEAERTGAVETRTQIPGGVAVDDVEVADDGTAVIEVSRRFLAGIPPEPRERTPSQRSELNARLAQVTYTATQFDEVESAKVVSGGTVVKPDLTREDYAPPAHGPKPIVKARGSRVPGTRRIQTRLAKLGYLPKKAVDGLDGYRTQQAVIAFQAWSGLARDGIVGPATTAALGTARRPKPRGGGPPRRIEVYTDEGVTLLVVDGRTKRAIHVSTGAPGTATPTGAYRVFRKELRSWSVPFSTWLPYASYFNQGIAFHEYPEVPPYPASHGCVRVPAPEAKGVYKFAALDTVVIVR